MTQENKDMNLVKRLTHVVCDFRPWDIMTKVRYFFIVQIYDLRTLERLNMIWKLALDLDLPEF